MPFADPRLKSTLLMIFSNYEAPSRVLLYLVVLGNYSISSFYYRHEYCYHHSYHEDSWSEGWRRASEGQVIGKVYYWIPSQPSNHTRTLPKHFATGNADSSSGGWVILAGRA